MITVTSKAAWTRATGAALTEKHTGKMTGLKSFSTSCLTNKACQENCKINGSVCEHCFARAMATGVYKKTLPAKLLRNSKAVQPGVWQLIPRINTPSGLFRFESFGDLATPEQFINYCNMAAANKHLKCALWTKNPHIIAAAFNKYRDLEKPSNLNIIVSSLFLNKSDLEPLNSYWFVDKIFTVYNNPAAAAADGKTVNCGARSCATCRKCYEKNSIKELIELLK